MKINIIFFIKKNYIIHIMLSRRLKKEIKMLKDDNQDDYYYAEPNEDDITKWSGYIMGPEDTPYEGGKFELNIEFTDNFPYKPPIVYFTTPIYHCNINSQGGICLDILKYNWSPALSVGKLLMSISSLLAEPNPNDPLVPSIAQQYKDFRVEHDSKAKEYTKKYAIN